MTVSNRTKTLIEDLTLNSYLAKKQKLLNLTKHLPSSQSLPDRAEDAGKVMQQVRTFQLPSPHL